jgi:hypothetical protein
MMQIKQKGWQSDDEKSMFTHRWNSIVQVMTRWLLLEREKRCVCVCVCVYVIYH